MAVARCGHPPDHPRDRRQRHERRGRSGSSRHSGPPARRGRERRRSRSPRRRSRSCSTPSSGSTWPGWTRASPRSICGSPATSRTRSSARPARRRLRTAEGRDRRRSQDPRVGAETLAPTRSRPPPDGANGTRLAPARPAASASVCSACPIGSDSLELVPGVDLVAEETGLDEKLARADVVVTGEGRIDAQTAFGKTALGVARRAQAAGVALHRGRRRRRAGGCRRARCARRRGHPGPSGADRARGRDRRRRGPLVACGERLARSAAGR